MILMITNGYLVGMTIIGFPIMITNDTINYYQCFIYLVGGFKHFLFYFPQPDWG